MNGTALVVLIVLSFAVYRVTRFIVSDTLFEGSRLKLILWLRERESMVAGKLIDLIECCYCVSVWVATATVVLADLFGMSVPEPFWVWLAICGGSMAIWNWTERDE